MGVALAASALFGWGVVLRRAGREEVDRRLRDGVLALLGVLAAFCWWNLFAFHFYSPVHSWDQFHYYVGSKYQAELGYERLYACTAVKDDGTLCFSGASMSPLLEFPEERRAWR